MLFFQISTGEKGGVVMKRFASFFRKLKRRTVGLCLACVLAVGGITGTLAALAPRFLAQTPEYDYRRFSISDSAEDYENFTHTQEQMLDLLRPTLDGAPLLAQTEEAEAPEANLIIENGVKVYNCDALQVADLLSQGGVPYELLNSEYYSWYFPVRRSESLYHLLAFTHTGADPQQHQAARYYWEDKFIYSSYDWLGGYAFHPEVVQVLLETSGIWDYQALVPVCYTYRYQNRGYQAELIYIACRDQCYVIPYGLFFSDVDNIRVYSGEEFLRMMKEKDALQPTAW